MDREGREDGGETPVPVTWGGLVLPQPLSQEAGSKGYLRANKEPECFIPERVSHIQVLTENENRVE